MGNLWAHMGASYMLYTASALPTASEISVLIVSVKAAVHGYHVYQVVWDPNVAEGFSTQQ